MGVVLVHGLVPDVQTLTPDLIPTPNLNRYSIKCFQDKNSNSGIEQGVVDRIQ